MMKFWKRAAKGKSGCLVKPPEPSTHLISPVSIMSYTLEPICEEDLNLLPIIGAEKSRLTIDLQDILSDRNILSYFVQYMESNFALKLIKFWLDAEYFKHTAADILNTMKDGNNGKLNRTTSIESSIKTKHICETTGDLNKQNNFQNIGEYEHCSESFLNTGFINGPSLPSNYCENENARLDCSKHLSDSKPIVADAINLFKKYIALEAPHRLDLPDDTRNTIVQNICHPDGLIDVDCFETAQELVHERLGSYVEGFRRSPLYVKAQIDILTNGSLTLDDIVYNEMTLFYFTEYLEQESCSILLEFLIALANFSDNLTGAHDFVQAQKDAIILYDKYFSLQATSPIGFTNEVRSQVEQNICREGGPLPDCFHKPFRIVHCTLSRYVKHFLESELYFKHLSEMITSVDKTWQKKSLSDCSSEFTINTQNTLLAMGDFQFRSKRRNHSVPDMSIASNHLYDADSLWRHKRNDGLSLGRINSLGRFESKLEPYPDKKQTSILKKVVSRLVPSTMPRVDEEMAWQVAHMIVKDVTDLTMAPSTK